MLVCAAAAPAWRARAQEGGEPPSVGGPAPEAPAGAGASVEPAEEQPPTAPSTPPAPRARPEDGGIVARPHARDAALVVDAAAAPLDAGPLGGDGGDALDAGLALDLEAGAALDAGDAALFDGGLVPADDEGGGSSAPGLLDDVIPDVITESVSAVVSSETTSGVVRTLLGLVGLLALAWAAGHERVRRLEERLGLGPMMVSGLPFVALGLFARLPGIDVLSEDVVVRLTPLLQFGLGWIGFHTGFQLDSRSASQFPRGSGSAVILLTVLPFALITTASAATLYLLGLDQEPQHLVQDAVLLGLAGALSAPALGRLRVASQASADLLRAIGVLDDILCVVGFALVAAWLRPASEGDEWILPGVGWAFVTFGMAAVLGLITYFVLRGTESRAEKISLLLGAVSLTTGIAAVFSLPPLVVCFLAGVLLRNLPGEDKEQLEASFSQLERPIYYLFLLIVGALWQPEFYVDWLLVPVFLLARTLGRWGGAKLTRRIPEIDRPAALAETPDTDLAIPPMGQLAIAFIITAQALYASEAVRAMVNAVVVSAVVFEIASQLTLRQASNGKNGASRLSTPPRAGEARP